MSSIQTQTSKKPVGSQSPARPRAPSVRLDRLQANARRASEFLKAIAHEGRLVILCQLARGEKSVSELAQTLDMRQPAVSQRLARLREEGLVTARRNGKSIYYSLSRPDVREVVEALERAFCRR